MNIQIKKLHPSDLNLFKELIAVFENVFEMKDFTIPSDMHLHQLLKKDDFFAFVAILDNKVIGGLSSYIMHQYYETSPLVYIFDLAVKREFQRQGIGRMLIEANNTYSANIGVEAVMVQADLADDHAIDFYHSTGAVAEKVIHFEYILNNKST